MQVSPNSKNLPQAKTNGLVQMSMPIPPYQKLSMYLMMGKLYLATLSRYIKYLRPFLHCEIPDGQQWTLLGLPI